MKKFIKIEIGLGAVLLVAVLQFSDVVSLKNLLHLNFDEILVDPTLDEIQDTYLHLLDEYNKLKLNTESRNKDYSKSTFQLIRNPFELPKSTIKKNDNRLNRKTSTRINNQSQNRLRLCGILWDEKSPSAIIGNKIVYVGSRVGSYKVIQILPHKVILSSRRKTLVLRLPTPRFNIQ